jgi:hypothetical protein
MTIKTGQNLIAILKLSGYHYLKPNHLIKWSIGGKKRRFHANIQGEIIFIHQDIYTNRWGHHYSEVANNEVAGEIKRIKNQHCL